MAATLDDVVGKLGDLEAVMSMVYDAVNAILDELKKQNNPYGP
jgi:hypothetical protein